jgi:hypothetical protein
VIVPKVINFNCLVKGISNMLFHKHLY